MSTIRVTGSILLGLALVFSAVLVFVPLGTAWHEPSGSTVRTTNTYYLFTMDVDITPRGQEAGGRDGASYQYFDESLGGTDGITGLRALGPLWAGAMLLTFMAFVFTVLPGVRQSRAGGVFALLGLGGFALAAAGGYLGMTQHTTARLSGNTEVTYGLATVLGLGLAILLVAVATGLGLARVAAARRTAVWADEPIPRATGGQPAQRRLRCPDCSTLVAAPVGRVPICPNCDFGSDYIGPAGQPVPGHAVTN